MRDARAGEDLVFSDLLAGLRLVHQWQRGVGVLDTATMLQNTTQLS